MSDAFIEMILAPALGVALVVLVVWIVLRGGKKPRRKHPMEKAMQARRDNDRNVPPSEF